MDSAREAGSVFEDVRELLRTGTPFALCTVVTGTPHLGTKLLVRLDGSHAGNLPDEALASKIAALAVRGILSERVSTVEVAYGGEVFSVFFDAYPGTPKLLIIGAGGAAGPLAEMALVLGYAVTITDARATFADPLRFPRGIEVVKGWPQDVLPGLSIDEATYVVLLTHDPRFDEPALTYVVPSPARYVGVIGSRATQVERFEWLRSQRWSDDQLHRVYGPVGLDLGGRSPAETALAILAEITAVRHGRTGGHLRALGPAATT